MPTLTPAQRSSRLRRDLRPGELERLAVTATDESRDPVIRKAAATALRILAERTPMPALAPLPAGVRPITFAAAAKLAAVQQHAEEAAWGEWSEATFGDYVRSTR